MSEITIINNAIYHYHSIVHNVHDAVDFHLTFGLYKYYRIKS